jgi:LEA14-like dessication related protein
MNLRLALRKIHLLIIFYFIFACPSVYGFKNPEIEIKIVRIVGIDQSAVTLEGTLDIFNPNEMGSRFSGYRYQLEVEGQRLTTGESDHPFKIPASGTVSITIPATLLIEDLMTLGKKGFFNRDLTYILSGTVFLDSWIGKISLPFSYQETINISDLLREKTRQFLQGL